jgi:hypothetical protein
MPDVVLRRGSGKTTEVEHLRDGTRIAYLSDGQAADLWRGMQAEAPGLSQALETEFAKQIRKQFNAALVLPAEEARAYIQAGRDQK